MTKYREVPYMHLSVRLKDWLLGVACMEPVKNHPKGISDAGGSGGNFCEVGRCIVQGVEL